MIELKFGEAKKKIKSLERLDDLQEESILPEGAIADAFAQKIVKEDVKTAQIRRFFNVVKSIQRNLEDGQSWNSVKSDFYMLTPQFAYARGRELITENYYDFMTECLKKIDQGDEEGKKANLLKFASLFEAIVGYHKYYEKKKEENRKGKGKRR